MDSAGDSLRSKNLTPGNKTIDKIAEKQIGMRMSEANMHAVMSNAATTSNLYV